MIKDATGSSDALRKFKQNESLFQRPVVVDWNHGRAGRFLADGLHIQQIQDRERSMLSEFEMSQIVSNVSLVAGENESEIMNMIKTLPKETDIK